MAWPAALPRLKADLADQSARNQLSRGASLAGLAFDCPLEEAAGRLASFLQYLDVATEPGPINDCGWRRRSYGKTGYSKVQRRRAWKACSIAPRSNDKKHQQPQN